MGTRAAKGRKLFSLAAVCVLVAAVLAPAPASASRTLARATAPDLERLPALEVAGAAAAGVAQAEPLPLYTFVDGVALDRVAGQPDDQVEAAVGRQRHRLHLVASELARPGELVWGSKTATGVSAWLDADKHLERSDLRPQSLRPSFQGLWTDPVSGLSYARNRWYDARSASWLSEDPMGAVDSVNLYAFVGWGPQSGTDPMGLSNAQFRGAYARGGLDAVRDLPDMKEVVYPISEEVLAAMEQQGNVREYLVQPEPSLVAAPEGSSLYGSLYWTFDNFVALGALSHKESRFNPFYGATQSSRDYKAFEQRHSTGIFLAEALLATRSPSKAGKVFGVLIAGTGLADRKLEYSDYAGTARALSNAEAIDPEGRFVVEKLHEFTVEAEKLIDAGDVNTEIGEKYTVREGG